MPLPHPWRRLRDLTHVTLLWADLGPGMLGLTDHASSTITLALGMNQAQRRCTLAHELLHLEAGPAPVALAARDEQRVRRDTARELLPDVHAMGEALAWAHSLPEAAEELWVDVEVLEDRLRWLHPAERGLLQRRLADGPGCG